MTTQFTVVNVSALNAFAAVPQGHRTVDATNTTADNTHVTIDATLYYVSQLIVMNNASASAFTVAAGSPASQFAVSNPRPASQLKV